MKHYAPGFVPRKVILEIVYNKIYIFPWQQSPKLYALIGKNTIL